MTIHETNESKWQEQLKKIPLGKSSGKALQSPRYSSRDRILKASTLDSVF